MLMSKFVAFGVFFKGCAAACADGQCFAEPDSMLQMSALQQVDNEATGGIPLCVGLFCLQGNTAGKRLTNSTSPDCHTFVGEGKMFRSTVDGFTDQCLDLFEANPKKLKGRAPIWGLFSCHNKVNQQLIEGEDFDSDGTADQYCTTKSGFSACINTCASTKSTKLCQGDFCLQGNTRSKKLTNSTYPDCHTFERDGKMFRSTVDGFTDQCLDLFEARAKKLKGRAPIWGLFTCHNKVNQQLIEGEDFDRDGTADRYCTSKSGASACLDICDDGSPAPCDASSSYKFTLDGSPTSCFWGSSENTRLELSLTTDVSCHEFGRTDTQYGFQFGSNSVDGQCFDLYEPRATKLGSGPTRWGLRNCHTDSSPNQYFTEEGGQMCTEKYGVKACVQYTC